jgi:hypothetical protein
VWVGVGRSGEEFRCQAKSHELAQAKHKNLEVKKDERASSQSISFRLVIWTWIVLLNYVP